MNAGRDIISSPHQTMRLSASWDAFCVSTAGTIFFIYYSILLMFSRTFLQDGDTLWHIRTGQWILDHSQVPTVDYYSYTAVGTRWISTEWLSEIFFALSFKIGEWRGVVVLSALSCAAIIAIICFYLVRNLRFSVAIGWTALTALAISPHFLARPHLFSYIVELIWVIKLLENYDRGDFRSSIPSFCALMVLWANLHPSFTFGLALFYVVVGYSCFTKLLRRDYLRCKDELFAVIVVSICALLTPYGIFSALLTVQTMNMKFAMQHVNEWLPPNYSQNPIHLFLIVGFFMIMTGLGVRLRGPRLIAYGLILILALSYTRGLAIFYLLTPIIFARPLTECATWLVAAQPSQNTVSSKAARSLDPVLLYLQKQSKMIFSICLAGAIFVTAAFWREIGVGPPNSVAPREAIEFVKKAGITGNVFNVYDFGGYLIFNGIPTFVDSRVPPYTDNFLREYYDIVKVADIKRAFQLLDQHKVDWALLRPTDPLAKALVDSKQWNNVYSDNSTVVFVRSQ